MRNRETWIGIGAVLTMLVTIVMSGWWYYVPSKIAHGDTAAPEPLAVPKPTLFVLPGIADVPVWPTSTADMRDDAWVIGVVEKGAARAYALDWMASPRTHVVNDVLSGVAVSVTYCDITRCVRVFRDPTTDKPLELATGGFYEELLLRYKDVFFAHHSDLIPLEEAKYQVMTWEEWAKRYPDSTVYRGPYGPAADRRASAL